MSLSFANPFFDVIGWFLAFFYGLIPNYGVAIILLTIVMRLILYPLTAKQAKSMLAMQRIQPEIKKLQAKYKNDRQKLNEEMMKFYKENKVNPFGGCLPLLVQMPVFIALFRVLRKPQNYIPKSSDLFHALCSTKACTHPHGLSFLGMDLSKSAAAGHGSFVAALPYFVLIALLVVTSFLQQQQMMRNQSAPNPQMQMVGKIMPIFFAFIALNLPAGVVVYFFVSNLWQMGQQEVVFRRYGTADAPAAPPAIDAKSTETSTGASGLLARLMKPAAPKPNGEAEPAANGDSAEPPESKPKPKPAASGPPGQSRKRSNKKRRR